MYDMFRGHPDLELLPNLSMHLSGLSNQTLNMMKVQDFQKIVSSMYSAITIKCRKWVFLNRALYLSAVGRKILSL